MSARRRRLMRLGVLGWSPLALFESDTDGAILRSGYDGAIYQDSAGTTAGADGQPMGLMLDSRYGLVRGSERVVDGTFDTADDWSVIQGGSIADGKLYADTDSASIFAVQSNRLTEGRVYQTTFTIEDISGSVSISLGGERGGAFSSQGTFTEVIKSAGTSVSFQTRFSAGTATIDNVSVREIPGYHATQPTASFRPTLNNGMLDITDADDEMTVALPAIASATVGIAKPTGAEISTGVDLSGGSYTIDEDGYAWVIIDRALTADETSKLTNWLNTEAGL